MRHHFFKQAALLAVAAGITITACKQDLTSDNATNPLEQSRAAALPPAANPEIAHATTANVSTGKGKNAKTTTYVYLTVMNADGSNATNIASMAYSDMSVFGFPKWSPWGTSTIFYRSYSSLPGGHTVIRAIDVAVVNGVPTGSNDRLILDLGNYLTDVQRYSPSPSATTQEFAVVDFVTKSLYTVPATGGAPTLLYSSPGLSIADPTWSPDAKYIAFRMRDSATGVSAIRVIDRATGTFQYDLCSGSFYAIGNIDWSRTGANTIAFQAVVTQGGSTVMYTVTAAPGSTAVSTGKSASWISWSPDNAKIGYDSDATTDFNEYDVAAGTSTKISTWGRWVDWKR